MALNQKERDGLQWLHQAPRQKDVQHPFRGAEAPLFHPNTAPQTATPLQTRGKNGVNLKFW
jgi:hypothetical protein